MNLSEIGLGVAAVLGTLIFLAAAVLIGAVMLRAAAKWAERLDLSFWSSAQTVLLYTLSGCVLGVTVAFLADKIGAGTHPHMIRGLLGPAGFMLQSVIISSRHHLSLGKGIKISIFMWLVGLIIGIGVAVLTVGFMSVMPSFN